MGLSITSVIPTIAVEDLDRAISFYQDKLGLAVRRLEGDLASALVEVGASDCLLLYKSGYQRGETTYCSLLTDDVDGFKTGWFKDSEGNTLAISSEIPEVMRKAA